MPTEYHRWRSSRSIREERAISRHAMPLSAEDTSMTRMTRRDFNKTATAIGAAAVTPALFADRVPGANERVRLGFIGLGNRGDQVLDAFLAHKDAEVVAVCDIHQPYLDFAARKIGTQPGGRGSCQASRDYRKLLDRRDLDAVVVCTPDH